jgi:hypothetical protein
MGARQVEMKVGAMVGHRLGAVYAIGHCGRSHGDAPRQRHRQWLKAGESRCLGTRARPGNGGIQGEIDIGLKLDKGVRPENHVEVRWKIAPKLRVVGGGGGLRDEFQAGVGDLRPRGGRRKQPAMPNRTAKDQNMSFHGSACHDC